MQPRAAVTALLIPAWLSACVGWQTQPIPPQQVLANEPGEVRVTTTNHPLGLVLEAPRIEGDSLVGQRSGRPLAVALSDVKTIAVLGKHDATANVVWGVGFLALGALIAAYAVSCSDLTPAC